MKILSPRVLRCVLLLAGALFVTACQTTGPAGKAGLASTADNALVMVASGFVCPAQVGAFRRTGGIQYDAAGQDVSVKYEAGQLIVLDVYSYPMQRKSTTAELRFRENEIKALHPDAKLLSESPITIRPGGVTHRGEKAVFNFAEVFRGDIRGPYKSQSLIFPDGPRWVAYRVTYTRDHSTRAEFEIERFLNALVWRR